MGTLKLRLIALSLVAWGAATEGAPPDDPAGPPARLAYTAGDYVKAVVVTYKKGDLDKAAQYIQAADKRTDPLSADDKATLEQYRALLAPKPQVDSAVVQVAAEAPPADRPASPVPPGQYVQAVAGQYQAGKFAKAGAYVAAADQYREQLTAEERATLDRYKALLARVPSVDGAVKPASTQAPAATAPQTAPIGGSMGRGGPSSDMKQQARWLLATAREQLRLGNVEEADKKLAEARALNIKWGLFELDTPTKLAEAVAKAKAAQPKPGAAATGDKATARAKLKQARDLLAKNDVEGADALAREVGGWGLGFGMMEDTPRKVADAARALRTRDQRRQKGKLQPNQGVYDSLVAEARAMLSAGRLDEAEDRARQASKLGVTPALTADRAENVLRDLAAARANAPATTPGVVDPAVAMAAAAPSASAIAERQGDQLLADGNAEGAKAKYLEAAADPIAAAEAKAEPRPIAEMPAAVVDAPTAGPGGAELDKAKALMGAGNFAAAREAATAAREAGAGPAADEAAAQVALAEQSSGLSLYDAALDALRKGEPARARALLMELSAGNLDEATAQKVQDLLTRIPADGKDAAGKASVGGLPVDDAEAVAAQKLTAEVGTKVAESRRMMETDPDKALALLEQTRAGVAASGVAPAMVKTMTRRLDVALELARADKVKFDERMKEKGAKAEIEQKKLRILLADQEKKTQYKALIEKAQAAMGEGKFADAEGFARKAQTIDPNEVTSYAMVKVAQTRRHYETSKNGRDTQNESNLLAFEAVDAVGTVPKGVFDRNVDFGEGFDALTTRRRDLANRLARKEDPDTAVIRAKLREKVSVDIDGQTLGEALEYLRNYTGLNIVADAAAMSEQGYSLATPITGIHLKDVALANVLKYILAPLKMNYMVDGGVVMLTSPTAAKSKVYPVVYNVADLVVPVPGLGMQPGPAFGTPGLNAPMVDANAPPPAAGIGSGGMSIKDGQRPNLRSDDFAPLINLIKASIAPNTWRNDEVGTPDGAYGMGAGLGGGGAGGAAGDDSQVGSITPFFLNISLIIRHTAEVHDDVVDLLRQLRRLQDLQVSIEVRFITVSDSFFEQIGVDFDFSIQSDTVNRRSSFAIPNPGASFAANQNGGNGNNGGGQTGAGTAPFLINPSRDNSIGSKVLTVGRTSNGNTGNFTQDLQIPFLQGSAENIAPFNAVPNVGATLGLAFLSDLEVYLFLTASQGDTRSNLVQAPKVTTFNGALASVSNFTSRNYVSSLQPIVANGAVAFQPQISSIPDGVQLFVTPVVSADRRYVRMTLSPQFITFVQFDSFTIPAAVSGFLGGSGTVNGTIQLPVTSVTNVSTTVTVPDGGTVLLGGVKRLREERREFGVPILAKTPMINRLFRNIGIGRTTDSLMLMVTPRIIILEEEEERLGVPSVGTTTPF